MKIIQLVLAALFATAVSAKLAAPKVGLKVNYLSNRNEKTSKNTITFSGFDR